MVNLHITLTPFLNASRVLKETGSLVQRGIAERVFIAALYTEGLHEFENIDEKRLVWRVKLRSRSWPKFFFFQFIKYLEFCWRISLYAERNRVKMVNVHKLSLLPLGVWLKFRFDAKLVYDAHELETETNGTYGFRKLVLKFTELFFIQFADLTIVVGWEIERWYRERYPNIPIVTVLNCPFYREAQRTQLLRDEFNVPNHKKIILYQGGLAVGRGVEALLKAFKCTNDDRYIIIFMGYGELELVIKKAASVCSKIYYKKAVSPNEVFQYTASADIGVSSIEDTCLSYRFCLPNKLFEYLMARIPVVVSDLPEMRKVVNEYGLGAVLEDWNEKEIFRVFDKIVEVNPIMLNLRLNDAAKEFSWKTQESIMVHAYRKYILNEAN